MKGKDHVEIAQAIPGDIAAVAKIDELHFDAVLHDSHDEDQIHLAPLDFPKPMFGLAVVAGEQGPRTEAVDRAAQAGRGRPVRSTSSMTSRPTKP
jgi:elongation factor G